ncbi:BTAD domain-containing putative transcriptional regulator [Spirillospora sp. NPDC048911]|uniref:AfsR/SARP family transcriptional regulator n=1 Tax=Spirillospora sp. NPDC048911 TaxID=3364527 RepID=UPI003719C4B0
MLGDVALGLIHAVTTQDDLVRLFGEDAARRVTQAALPGLYVAPTVTHALNHVGAAIVDRTARTQQFDLDDVSAESVENAEVTPLVFVLDPLEQATRASYELQRGARMAIGGLMLGDWPRGTTLTLDDSALVVDAVGTAAEGLLGLQLTTVDLQDVARKLTALGVGLVPMTTASAQTAPIPAVASASQRMALGLIRLFGGSEVTGPGERVSPSGDVEALLGLLAEHRSHWLARGDIKTMLWGDEKVSPDRVNNLLKSTRRKLRTALDLPLDQGDVILSADNHGLMINPDLYSVDVWQFRDLHRKLATAEEHEKRALLTTAVDLWAGPYLRDVPHSWARAASRKIGHDLLDALDQLADLEDDPGLAVLRLDKAAEIAPTDQHICRRRMHLYADMGRIKAAQLCYERLAETLTARKARMQPQTTEVYQRLTAS